MVYHRLRSVQPARPALEDDRDFPRLSRPGRPERTGRNLPLQTNVPDRAG